MAIEVIDKIKAKNNGSFKIADASDVEYTNSAMAGVNDVSTAIDTIYGILNAAPTLSYVDEDGYREGEKKYWEIGQQMRLIFQFTSSVSGKCTITITRNGLLYKTFSSDKGRIVVDLGTATEQNSYTYVVSGIDSIGRDANQTLSFNHILGGVEISSTFDYVIKNTVFTANTGNTVSIPVSISYAESGIGFDRNIIYSIKNKDTDSVITSGEYACGTQNWSSDIILQNIQFGNPGTYTLIIQGKVVMANTELASNILNYDFAVISANSIATTVIYFNTDGITTDDALAITFLTVSNVPSLSNTAKSMAVRGYLYRGANTTPIKEIRITGVSSGDNKIWNIGRLANAGDYRYELIGEPMSGASSSIVIQKAEGVFHIAQADTIGGTYETSNLIAYFNADDMDNSLNDPSVWPAINDNNYYFKLHGLNYDKNGWIVDPNDNSKMLKFTGDSYGELRHITTSGLDEAYSPITLMNSASLGNTFEIVFRTRCIGAMDACVISCRNETINNYGGYSIYYDSAKISSNEQNAVTPINESNDKFTHVTFVIDKNIRKLKSSSNPLGQITNSNIENLNTVATMNIYVNGVRTKVIAIKDTELFANTTAFPSMQLILNGYYSTTLREITGFGACEIKMIRIYNSALTASQIVGNYINSVADTTKRQALVNKNDANRADIPVVRFVRNKTIDANNNVSYGKYSADKSFSILNSIKTKKSSDPNIPTSKNSWVNCTMWYTYLDKEQGYWQTVKFDDVDVYLQGTSSLQFPIKNYKIKCFKTVDGARGSKNKFIPPNKIGDPEWQVPDSVYTLKCDYMEESHKNNTPTAAMYETVLAKVVDTCQKNNYGGTFSPCKRVDSEYTYPNALATVTVDGEDIEVKKYRDAINGFPILLYYNENDAVDSTTGLPLDYNALSNTEDGYYVNDNDVMVGTMMFNVDKSGSALGFEAKWNEDIYVKNPLTGEQVKYTDGTDVVLDTIPCISVEGSSNSAIPSAASFYTREEANEFTYNEYLKDKYAILKQNGTISQNTTYDQFYTSVQNNTYSDVSTHDDYMENGKGIFKNDYDYITATFEIRWAWTEELVPKGKELDEQTFNECTYGHLINTINWIKDSYNNEAKFKREFNQYFDFSYCCAYYLQMMTLIQVDNAGKNAMFDKWFSPEGGIDFGGLRPRPYDMDTQVCLDNSGEDRINVSAEINVALSPTGITGTYSSQAAASNMTTDSSHSRYTDYNTPNSKFWNAFGTFFRNEIVAVYGELRKEIYTADWICNMVNGLTSDIIGESFFNKDAAAKYMTQTYYETNNGVVAIHADMLPKLNGNRDSRYRQVIDQRLIFMDTFFQYSDGDSLNKSIMLRSYANSAGMSKVQIGISVYSPCYVQIDIGTGNDAIIVAYVDTNERYEYNDETYEGVLFTLPIMANDKDITIHAAGNIKSINHMENLVISQFNCGDAKKLTSIVIPSSNALTTLTTGSNTYLRTLNLSGSTRVSGTIDLMNCENIQSIDISNTNISTITLPDGGSLKTFVAQNCGLTSILFKNLQFLRTIDVTNCTSISSYEIDNCPLISEIDTSGYINLNKIIVSNCAGVSSLNLSSTNISEMSIVNCDRINYINLSACNGSIMEHLNLSTVYGLKTLNISSSQPANGIILSLPKYKTAEYASKSQTELDALIADGADILWHELNTFNANSSNLKNIVYGAESNVVNGECDFSQLTNLTSINIQSCSMINKLLNLKYVGNTASLFYNLTNCQSITGNITSTTNSAASMFNSCYKLSDISGLILNLSTVENASSAMSDCRVVTYDMAKQVLDALPNVTNLGSFLNMHNGRNTSTLVLESNMFENNTKVTSLAYCFYYTTITSVPTELFTPFQNTISNLQGTFYLCTNLVTVPNDLIKNCIKLTNCLEVFRGCTSLKNLFTAPYYYDIFPENSLIEDVRLFFYQCTSLIAASGYTTGNTTNGLKQMFDNLPSIKQADGMFDGCNFITTLPDGLFASNTNLYSIDAIFNRCTKITNIPERLFNVSNTNTTTHPNLKRARGTFNGCASMTGAIGSHFFDGAFNLADIGHKAPLVFNSSSGGPLTTASNGPLSVYVSGMFANTAISGYAPDFLSKLTKLTSVSMLFYKGGTNSSIMRPSRSGNNNDKLKSVYISDDNIPLGAIYNDIFNGLTQLKDVRYCFAGNTSITRFCDINGNDVTSPTLFNSCKNTLVNAEGLFAECTQLSIDVPVNLFKNCTKLITLKSCYGGCIALTGDIASDIFQGCTSLNNVSYMFFRCKSIGTNQLPTDIAIPSNLFDSCRSKLTNTSYMFAGCNGMQGQIQSGDATTAYNEEDGTTTVISINRYGLLSDCTSLISTCSMFRGCEYIKGKIPEDMFYTTNVTKLYNNLTDISYMFDNCGYLAMNSAENGIDARNKLTIYGQPLLSSDRGYLIPRNWLNKCPNITNIQFLFNRVSIFPPGVSDAAFTKGTMDLDDMTFSQQSKIQNARNAFSHCKSLNASITSVFMQNSLNSLTTAERIFAFSNIKQVGAVRYYAVFEKNTSETAKNTVLTNLSAAFYYANNNQMTGYAPSPKTKFNALTSSNSMIYNQTELSNFNNTTEFSTQQKDSMSYYDSSDAYTDSLTIAAATLT